jgi:hypothetical protein
MSEEHAERNQRLKATTRAKETPLNKGPAQVPCSPCQSPGVKRPNGHVEVGTGRKS